MKTCLHLVIQELLLCKKVYNFLYAVVPNMGINEVLDVVHVMTILHQVTIQRQYSAQHMLHMVRRSVEFKPFAPMQINRSAAVNVILD